MSKRLWIVAAVAVGVAAAAAGQSRANGAIWFVAPTGSDAASCTDAAHPCQTIAGALAKASLFDTIDVAVGTYTGSGGAVAALGAVDHLSLSGGWNAGFTSQVGLSTIDGGDARRGLTVAAGLTATVSRFEVVNASGAGIANDGTLTLDRSWVHDNASPGVVTTGGLTITNSTVSANGGGGLAAEVAAGAASVRLINSTIAGNTAAQGAGIRLATETGGQSTLELVNDTITGNTAQSGPGAGLVVNAGWSAHLQASIVAGNDAGGSGGDDVSVAGGFLGTDYSAGTGWTPAVGDIGPDGLDLQTLADNGGPVPTVALGAASTAVDAGLPSGCQELSGNPVTSDERGAPRPVGEFCDIGAYELQPPDNDSVAAARPLAAAGGRLAFDNVEATTEPAEPEHAGDEGGSSVWFSWTPSASGVASIDTDGSGFDTLLAVYAGSTVSGLNRLASNDDKASGETDSRLCLPVAAGSTYLIAVDGYGGDMGLGALDWGLRAGGDGSSCPTLPPVVTGAPVVGHALSATPGTWIGAGPPSYQWERCQAEVCDPIAGATASTYTPGARDVGTALRVDVEEGGALSTSDPTAAVATPPRTNAANGRIFWSSGQVIHSILPDGSSPQTLPGGGSLDPAPSPDGTRIAFDHNGDSRS